MRQETRREFLHLAASATAAGLLTRCASTHDARQQAKPPNIVLIVSDDHRYDALGCMGNAIIQTPNLDALAREGVLFQNNFCTTAICCTSRASILTGMYARRHGVTEFDQDLSPEMLGLSYPVQLRNAGYRTAFAGKYGVGVKLPAESFDFWRGFPGQGVYFYAENGKQVHSSDLLAEQAIEFLGTCRADQPFCLSLSFKAPHALDYESRPFPPAPRFEEAYRNTTIPAPKTATAEHYAALPGFLKNSEGRKRWEHSFGAPDRAQENIKDYYRLITGMDEAIGTVRRVLSDRGFAENTVILFTGDNGYFVGDRGLEGKWYAYEESIRTPLIIFDPRAGSKRPRQEMTLNIDLAPTILEIAGVKVPGQMQGRSLAPLLHGRSGGWREDWFYEHHFKHPAIPRSEGVRTEQWSYIRWIDAAPPLEELYDIRKDPLEEHNLAVDPGHAAILEDLRGRWRRYGTSLL